MPDAHQNMLNILMGVIAIFFAIVIGTLIFSVLKKPKPPTDSTGGPRPEPSSPEPAQLGSTELKELSSQSDVLNKISREKELQPAVPASHGVDTAQIVAPLSVEEVNLSQSLVKTRESFWGRIKSVVAGSKDSEVLENIEEILYTSDLGPQTVERLLGNLKKNLSGSELKDENKIKEKLSAEFRDILTKANPSSFNEHKSVTDRITRSEKPTVIMIIGVNGAGKTTTIGKLSSRLAQEGKKVLVAAGDTFRAAAGSQLEVWTQRAQVEIFSPEGVSDPSAVAFDAVSKAKAQGYDYVIVDTAGRLHTQAPLMEELKKMKRVISKVITEAPHETLLVLDANQGQNALMQAKEYHKELSVTGVVITKMDGTAKGGVAIGVANELAIPVKLIGVGEKITDLKLFNNEEFIQSILG